jgi:hypothetical protein
MARVTTRHASALDAEDDALLTDSDIGLELRRSQALIELGMR